jgi:hypothetical protein
MWVGDVPDEATEPTSVRRHQPTWPPPAGSPGRGLHFVSRAFSHERNFDFPLHLALVTEANAERKRLLP